jgi:hypothetical protein
VVVVSTIGRVMVSRSGDVLRDGSHRMVEMVCPRFIAVANWLATSCRWYRHERVLGRGAVLGMRRVAAFRSGISAKSPGFPY